MTTIEGLPSKLKIYRISGSKYWQMRFYNLGRYTIQSLKTTSLEEAKVFATQIFQSLVESGAYIPRTGTATIPQASRQQFLHDVIDEVLLAEQEKVRRDEIKHASYVMAKIRLESLIFDFSRPGLWTKSMPMCWPSLSPSSPRAICLLPPFRATWRKRARC
jgi:phospholipase C